VGAAATVGHAEHQDAWVEGIAQRLGPLASLVTRDLTLLGVVPELCPWALAPGAAASAARRLLAHSALKALDPRGGRFRLAFAFPALPEDEGALQLAECLVREHWARFRAGSLEGLPELVAHVPASRLEDPSSRRTLLPLVAAAAETGRLLLVLERGEPHVVTPWYRLAAPEAMSDSAALPVAGAVALNVGAVSGEDEASVAGALEPLVALAVKALRQKRSFLNALSADPSGPLYRVASGARPLVAGAKGCDLVHLVGVREAARRLEPEPPSAAKLAGRLRSYAAVRVAEEGRSVRLKTLAASDRDGEAFARFYAKVSAEPDLEPYPLPAGAAFAGAEPLLEPLSGTLVLRFPRERALGPEPLHEAIRTLARDPRLLAIRLAPWPDRSVRPGRTEL
jgi:hypothetical protein